MATQYAVHSFSHWQGASNPGHRVAVLPTAEEAEALVNKLSTCSFCTPWKSRNYDVGSCYKVYPSHSPADYQTAEDALIGLRDAQYDEERAHADACLLRTLRARADA